MFNYVPLSPSPLSSSSLNKCGHSSEGASFSFFYGIFEKYNQGVAEEKYLSGQQAQVSEVHELLEQTRPFAGCDLGKVISITEAHLQNVGASFTVPTAQRHHGYRVK